MQETIHAIGRASDRRKLRVLLFMLVLLLSSSATLVQGQFGRAATRPFSGKVNFTDKRKGHGTIFWFDAGAFVRTVWGNVRPQLIGAAQNFLNERDIGSGFRTSRTSIYLAENGTLFYGTDGTGLSLRFVLPRNRIETSLRVPGPSPSSTDPRAYALCDAEVLIDIDRSGSDLVAAPARLKWNCSRPQGSNLTGKAVIGLNNFLATLGGPDFIGQLTGPIRSGNLAMSSQLLFRMYKILPTKRQDAVFTFSPGGDAVNLTLEDDSGLPIVH